MHKLFQFDINLTKVLKSSRLQGNRDELMRIGIISDIHANLEALEATLKALSDQGADSYICLGDIVGYGPNPNECIERIKELKCPVLKGNHDEMAAVDIEIHNFNSMARSAILWTRDQITPENREYLNSLPYIYQNEFLFAVHSTPAKPENWDYILTIESALDALHDFTEPIGFMGHSHSPFFLEATSPEHGYIVRENILSVKSDCRYLVNVGSVGQPRDNNARSCCVLYDLDEHTLQRLRVSYDISVTQKKILDADLPVLLAHRLETGY